VVGWEALVEEGVTSASDLHLFHWVETAEEAWKIVRESFPDAARCV
jgi:predicted Rossmann-fold nucleotide-binding protein